VTYAKMIRRLDPWMFAALLNAHKDFRTTVYRCCQVEEISDRDLIEMTQAMIRHLDADPHICWRVIAALRPSALVHRSTQEVA
jgi:hypothetical protein